MLNWLKERLSEKSTATALIGLLVVVLQHANLPNDVIQSLTGLLSVVLCSSAVTEG